MRILAFLLTFLVFISGCSILNPYEERGYCDAKQVGGYCGTMSDVYKKVKEEMK